jgi:hypothetical protein
LARALHFFEFNPVGEVDQLRQVDDGGGHDVPSDQD